MTDTIPHPAPPLEDVRVEVARQALAELPEASDSEQPYFWIGGLQTALRSLVDGWPAGAAGGLDAGQREVFGQALAEAIEHRTPHGDCTDCDTRPEGLCNDHAADLDLTGAYIALARERRARGYAAEELLNHWQTHPRPAEQYFRDQDTRVGYLGCTAPLDQPGAGRA